jgi:hypothetical protein
VLLARRLECKTFSPCRSFFPLLPLASLPSDTPTAAASPRHTPGPLEPTTLSVFRTPRTVPRRSVVPVASRPHTTTHLIQPPVMASPPHRTGKRPRKCLIQKAPQLWPSQDPSERRGRTGRWTPTETPAFVAAARRATWSSYGHRQITPPIFMGVNGLQFQWNSPVMCLCLITPYFSKRCLRSAAFFFCCRFYMNARVTAKACRGGRRKKKKSGAQSD